MYSEKVAILGACMKKIFFLFLLSFCSTVSFAESMQFLTLLSHPVGSFAKLELQTNRQADIFQLNFCNGFINEGVINIGTETTPGSIEIQNLKMGANTKLLGNIAEYQVDDSTKIYAGATAKVKELDVNNDIVVNPASGKDFFVKVNGTLFSEDTSTIRTFVASFSKLTIPGVAKFDSGTSVSGSGLSWKQVNVSGCGTSDACKAYLITNAAD